MKNASFLALVVLINGCSILKYNSDDIKIRFKEISYGICETKTDYVIKMDNSLYRSLSSNFTLKEQTDKIPGLVGQQFGIEYVLKSKTDEEVTVEQVWIFPEPMIDEKGNEHDEIRFEMKKPTNVNTHSTYKLEMEYEVIKGTWTYQMYFKGKKIYERNFIVL